MELEEELCPYEIDHLDDTIHHTTEFARFYERIDNLGKFTTKCLNRCVEEDESFEKKQADFFQFKESFVSKPAMQEKLTKLYNVWSEFYIINIESMKEIRNDTLTQTIDPETLKARKLRLTAGHHVFTEISRLFYLIQRPRLLAEELDAERISLKNTKHNMWISILNSFDITDQYEEKEDKDVEVETLQAQMHAMWGKPIQSYTQTEVVLLIFFLTQQLNAIPCDCILEYRSVFEETWIRAAVLMQEAHKGDILTDIKMRVSIDVDDLFIANRMFGTFVSFYMGEIMRRFFYYDLLSKRPMALTKEELPENIVNKVHAWIHSFIDSFADEAFIDMYVTNASDAYNFVGDEKWFKYAYPNEVFSRAACLAKFRPHLYRRYFSEERITKNLLMENVKSSHVARTYIFKAITNYIQMKTGNTDIKWDSAVVIHSDEIQMSAHVLEAKKRPLMLQVLSSYYCYYELNVYITDDLFEALGVWVYLLNKYCNNSLHGYDLSAFIKDLVTIQAPSRVQGRNTKLLL